MRLGRWSIPTQTKMQNWNSKTKNLNEQKMNGLSLKAVSPWDSTYLAALLFDIVFSRVYKKFRQ